MHHVSHRIHFISGLLGYGFAQKHLYIYPLPLTCPFRSRSVYIRETIQMGYYARQSSLLRNDKSVRYVPQFSKAQDLR